MPGKAEITHFNDSVFSEQHVLGLDVTVDAVVHVTVVDCLQNLPYDAHCQWQGDAVKFKEKSIVKQVTVTEEYKSP